MPNGTSKHTSINNPDFKAVPTTDTVTEQEALKAFKDSNYNYLNVQRNTKNTQTAKRTIEKQWGDEPESQQKLFKKIALKAKKHKKHSLEPEACQDQECNICLSKDLSKVEGQTVDDWIECDSCDKNENWMHARCVSAEKIIVQIIKQYTCPDCFERKHLPFIRYLSSMDVQEFTMNSDQVKECFDKFAGLSRIEKRVLKHAIPISKIKNLYPGVELSSVRGLDNPFKSSLCWLISFLQVFAGTSVINYLPGQVNCTLYAVLKVLHDELKKKRGNAADEKSLLEDIQKHLKLDARQQHDVHEGYLKIMNALLETEKGDDLQQSKFRFGAYYAHLTTCIKCGDVRGEVQYNLDYQLHIPRILSQKNIKSFKLKSLINNEALGNYQIPNLDDNRRCKCDENDLLNKDEKIHLSTCLMLNSPEFYTIHVIRYNDKCNNKRGIYQDKHRCINT